MNFLQAISAIQRQSDEYVRLLSAWTVADFRGENRHVRHYIHAQVAASELGGQRFTPRTALSFFATSSPVAVKKWHTVNLWVGLDSPDSGPSRTSLAEKNSKAPRQQGEKKVRATK